MNKIKKYGLQTILLLTVFAALWSCTSMDEGYKEFLKNGEISYTGKIDSLYIYGGNNRVNVKGLIISDPKVSEVRIFWNTRKDSLVVPITRTSGIDVLDVIIPNLGENIYNFEVRTYDKLGNKSIPVYKIGNTYGARYQATLTADIMNRNIATGISSGSTLTGTLDGLNDFTTKSSYTILTYTATDNTEKQLTINTNVNTFTINDFKSGTDIKYKTAYLPEKGAIDVFFTPEKTFYTQADVTSTYIVNPGFETGPITPTTAFATIVDRVEVVPGWTSNVTAGTGTPVLYRKLAPVFYGSTYNTSANAFGVTPSSTPARGNSLLAVKLHWMDPAPKNELFVQQTLNLPVGTYTLTWDSNVGQIIGNASSMMGYEIGGLSIYDSFPTAINTWKNHNLVFKVQTPTTVNIKMGYKKTGSVGGGSSPILFIDNMRLLRAKL